MDGKITKKKETNQIQTTLRKLKGQSQGHNAIFRGLKMTFRTKILKKTILH